MSTVRTELVTGRYRLIRQIGRGGMGIVWHARDEQLDRDVAIKEINALARHQTPATIQRALREARACAQLNHPGIITVHDIADHDDRPWIVMELINGRSLAHIIREDGPLPEQRPTREAGCGQTDAGRCSPARRYAVRAGNHVPKLDLATWSSVYQLAEHPSQ